MSEILPLESSEVPVEKDYTLGETYAFLFRYNEVGDFFTVEIRDLEAVLLFTGKLTYANALIDAVVLGLNLNRLIIPLNIGEFRNIIPLPNQRVGFADLGNTTFLFLGTAIIG